MINASGTAQFMINIEIVHTCVGLYPHCGDNNEDGVCSIYDMAGVKVTLVNVVLYEGSVVTKVLFVFVICGVTVVLLLLRVSFIFKILYVVSLLSPLYLNGKRHRVTT